MSEHRPAVNAYRIAYRTDVGRKRTNNEDAVGASVPSNVAQLQRDGALLVVADGVGGHEFGERASQYVVKTLLREYYRMPNVPPEGRLTHIISQASRSIHTKALEELGEGKRMATTVVAAVLRDGTVQVAHVGDSRAYLIRNGQAYLLTRDHSFVAEKVRAGLMTPEEAERSKFRSRLTQSVGGSEEVTVDVTPPIPLVSGDQILLCSDGLTRYVSDEELSKICNPSSPPQEIVGRLIQLANERGGADNITAALARYQPEGAHSQPAKSKALPSSLVRAGLIGVSLALAFAMGLLVRGLWGSNAAAPLPSPTSTTLQAALPTVPAMATPTTRPGKTEEQPPQATTAASVTEAPTQAAGASPGAQEQAMIWPIEGVQGSVKFLAAAAGKVAVLLEKGDVYLAPVVNVGQPAWQRWPGNQAAAVALSPGGKFLAEGHLDGTVTVYSAIASQQAKGTFRIPGPVQSLTFAPDGKTMALVDAHGGVWQAQLAADGRWQLTGKKPLWQAEAQPVKGLALSPDWLAVAFADGVKVVQWPQGKQLAPVANAPSATIGLAFSPDNHWLLAVSEDGIMLWERQEAQWQPIGTPKPLPGQPTGVACPAADQCVVAVATPGGNLDKGEVLWITLPALASEKTQMQMLHVLPTGGVASLDARRVVIGTDQGVRIVVRP